ncbi:glycosyltransferase family 4 protein [Georgenia muralis]
MSQFKSENRICFAVTYDGSLAFYEGLAIRLANAGWDVHIISAPGRRLTALTNRPGITAHPVAMRRKPSPLMDLASLLHWMRTLREVRPDVLVAGTPKASLLAMVAGAATSVPHRIYHVLGLRLETTRGLPRYVLWSLERITATFATEVLSVSRSLTVKLVELRIAPATKITMLGNGSSGGVDTARFDPGLRLEPAIGAEWTAGNTASNVECPTVGYVGRLTPDKGIHFLYRASRILSERKVGHRLLLVGRSESDDALTGIPDNAVIINHLDDVRPAYAAMDVLCLPTLREGFPNVCLEAASMGVPVVTTDATGARDSIVTGKTGLIVRAGDAGALAEAIEFLIRNDAERERMGREGREFVKSSFERDDVWSAHEAHLDRIVHSLRGR